MEQEVLELGRTTRVIADIRAQEGPTAPTRYADVMVTHYAYQQHGEWNGSAAGRAVNDAEICKTIDIDTKRAEGYQFCLYRCALKREDDGECKLCMN